MDFMLNAVDTTGNYDTNLYSNVFHTLQEVSMNVTMQTEPT